MRRREFISLLGGAAAWPRSARAQQPGNVRRIGVLIALAESDPEAKAWVGGFMQGLVCEADKYWRRLRTLRITGR